MSRRELGTRRNGLPQACEPCRKAKLRCDHSAPFCGRCVRRGKTNACVYHPAPMTKPRITRPSFSSEDATNHERMGVMSMSPPARLPSTSSALENSTLEMSSASSNAGSSKGRLFKKPNTPYSTTSFSAVFSENQATFGPLLENMADTDGEISLGDPEDLSQSTVSRAQLALGVAIMRDFPSYETSERLLEAFKSVHEIWLSRKQVRHCLSTFWSTYGLYMRGNRSAEGLTKVVNDLYQNGIRPISEADSSTWHNWFGGPRVRWEMMGILFSFFGIAFHTVQETDPIFRLPEQRGLNRLEASDRMRVCTDACLKICEQDNTLNDIVICAMKNAAKLRSICVGDESDQLASCFVSTTGSFVTLGLHRLPKVARPTPLSEYRNALFASIYYLEKSDSLFNARPPVFSRHYCTYQIPLDLSDEELFSDQETFHVAKANLDENGWNRKGTIHTLTWLRASAMLTPLREEVLELALGVNPQVTEGKIDQLILKLDETIMSYPPQMQYENLHKYSEDPSDLTPDYKFYVVTRSHLECLQTLFLLERIKISHCKTSRQPLFQVAQEMMTVVLSFWLQRDKLLLFNYSFHWTCVCYGIPSAGVLCVELLKSIKSPREEAGFQFSRADAIQNLTLFIGFLEWVRRTDGNYDLCNKLARAIKRIIEQVLDPKPAAQAQPLLQTQPGDMIYGNEGADVNDTSIVQFDPMWMPQEDMDCLDWLHTVDWTQGNWLDFNQVAL